MTSALWLLWSCTGTPPAPTALRRLAADTVAAADSDGDGRISAEEYAPVSFTDDPLSDHDTDGDGALSVDEIVELLLTIDPSQQQESRRREGRDRGKGKSRGKGKNKGKRR